MVLVHNTLSHCALYKCIKFQPNSFNSVQLTERTRNCIYLCYKGNNLKNVMVLVHGTLSQCALQMYIFVEISVTVIKF